MDQLENQSFRERLDAIHQWPCRYTFKFIVPVASRDELLQRMPIGTIRERLSSSGRYLSLTIDAKMQNSTDVLTIYERVRDIERIISL